MRSRTRAHRWGIVFAVLAFVAGGAAFWRSDSIAIGMIAIAPSPGFAPVTPPVGVSDVVDVERPGAHIRAWVFEPTGPARGTVLLLHGIRASKLGQTPRARQYASRGLRAVTVDSRGHGESSGRFLTYGVEESRDLVALVDELAQRGKLSPPLGVIGSSYGAATAIQYAARDSRVDTVVASASFASLREVVPAYIAWMGGPLAMLVPKAWIDARIDSAARAAGIDADAACPRCVAPSVEASVLLIHSRDDERIPYTHSIAIRDALRSESALLLVDGVGHVNVSFAPAVTPTIDRWIEHHFAPR